MVGATRTHTFTVAHNGADNASTVTFTASLPTQVSLVSSATTQGSCSGTAKVTCALGAMGATQSVTVTIVVKAVSSGTAVTVGSVSSNLNDTVPTNNTVRVTTKIVPPLTAALTYEPDRDVRAGETILVTVTFNRSVTGSPTIAIDTPGVDLSAVTLTATSDPNVWTYSYKVPEGSDGQATVTIGGVASQSGGASIELTNNKFNIDSTGALVALTYQPNASVSAGETLTITATFDREITGTPTISIDTAGTDLSPAAMTKTSDPKVWTYSYSVPANSDGDAVVTIAGGTDQAGNANKPATNNKFPIGPVKIGVRMSYQPSGNIVPGTTVVITATFDRKFTGTPSIGINTQGPDVSGVVMTPTGDPLVWVFTYVVPEGTEGLAEVSLSGLTGGTNSQVVTLTNSSFLITGNTTDLSVGVTASAETAVRSGNLTYTITVVNLGPATATGVTLVNDLPGAVRFDSVAPASVDCNVVSGSVICDLGTLAQNEAAVVLIDIIVDSDAEGILVNRSSVSGSEVDPISGNDVDTVETPVIVGVLSYVVSILEGEIENTGIVLTDSPDPVFLGNDLTYDLDVSNSGSEVVTEVNLIVTLPSAVVFESAVVNLDVGNSAAQFRPFAPPGSAPRVAALLAGPVSQAALNVGECTEDAGTVICALGSLQPGQVARVTIVVAPTAPGILNNQAKLVKIGQDPGAPSAKADESTTVLLMTDLSIAFQDVSTSATAGDQITFDFLVTNDGPSDASGVFVSETLPAGLRLVPSGVDPADCTVSGNEITCLIGSLAGGESRLLSLTLAIDPSASGDLLNTLTVAGAEADFDSSRNSASATISITAIADLSLKRTDFVGPRSEEPKVNDDEIVSVFTIGNNGPSDATNIILTNELSVDVVLVSVIGDSVECRVTGGTVTCELGDLANGETATFTLVLAPKTGGQISSGVGVKADQSPSTNLDPWEFFIDLSNPSGDIAPPSAWLDQIGAKNSNRIVGFVLLGLSLLAVASIFGRNILAAGKQGETAG